MNIFRGGRADRIIYKEGEGKKIPQGGIELNTSGKMKVRSASSITLNSCIELWAVVHCGPSF